MSLKSLANKVLSREHLYEQSVNTHEKKCSFGREHPPFLVEAKSVDFDGQKVPLPAVDTHLSEPALWLRNRLPCRISDAEKEWVGEMKKDILGFPDKEEQGRIRTQLALLHAARTQLGAEAIEGTDGKLYWQMPRENEATEL